MSGASRVTSPVTSPAEPAAPVAVRTAADVVTGEQWTRVRPTLTVDADVPGRARREVSVLLLGPTDATMLADVVERIGSVVTGLRLRTSTLLRGSVEEAVLGATGSTPPDVVVLVPWIGAAGHEGAAGILRAAVAVRAQWPGATVVQLGLLSPTTHDEVADAGGLGPARDACRAANGELREACGAEAGSWFVDVELLRERLGRATWTDARLERLGLGAVSVDGLVAVAREIVRVVGAATGTSRRVLATDLDNTFWGGVLGEVGPQGVLTGDRPGAARYVAYQRFLAAVRASGVEVVAVSKNEPEVVRAAFASRDDWAFGYDDFARVSCGWDPKSVQLERLARSMHLSLDKFLLVDDNPFECEEVAHRYPQVDVVRFDPSVDQLWPALDGRATLPPSDGGGRPEVDVARAASYQALARAEEDAAAFGSREEFLASLRIDVSVAPATDADLTRVHALVRKTNQMNVTLRRTTERETAEYLAAPTTLALTMRCTDRYADHGLTGFAGATVTGDAARLDFFCMSCRVLGRQVERLFLREVVRGLEARGATHVEVEHRDGGQNAIALDLLTACGFVEVATGRPNVRVLRLAVADWPQDAVPGWFEGTGGRT